jgi:hypothetical protein
MVTLPSLDRGSPAAALGAGGGTSAGSGPSAGAGTGGEGCGGGGGVRGGWGGGEEGEQEEEVDSIEETYLAFKAEEAARLPPPPKKKTFREGIRNVTLMNRTLAEPAIKAKCLQHFMRYPEVSELARGLLGQQWEKCLAILRSMKYGAAAVAAGASKKKHKKHKKKKGKHKAPPLDEFDIRPLVKLQMINVALKKKRDKFVDVEIADWRKDMLAFERFMKVNAKHGKKPPPRPKRPVFIPILTWTQMKWFVEQGCVAELGLRALEL